MDQSPEPPGRRIITLTTDFGGADGTVGAMIGVIRSIAPDVDVVVATSDIPAQDVIRGAWALTQIVPFYPPGTVHVAVVDPGVGGERRMLVAETDRSFLVGPDNGVLSYALREAGDVTIRAIKNRDFCLAPIGVTFDGRDCFAPCAAHLARGVDPAQLGPVVGDAVKLAWPAPTVEGGRIRGEVLLEDHFGNLITNIPYDLIAVAFAGDPVALTIDGVSAGELVGSYEAITDSVGGVINGTGLMEIAAPCGSAQKLLGKGRRAQVTVHRAGDVI